MFVGGGWYFFNDDGSFDKGIWIGPGDVVPVPGDYDGDGHDDAMVFSGGAWSYFDVGSGALVPGKSVWTGMPAHVLGGTSRPEPLDVNGDGVMDLSIFAGGPWHFYNANGSWAKGIWTGGVGEIALSARPLLP